MVLPFDEAIDEIRKTNLNNLGIELEVLLSKQRHNYRNMYAAYKIDSIPHRIEPDLMVLYLVII